MELKDQLEKDLIAWDAVICSTQCAMMAYELNLKDMDNRIASSILNVTMEALKKTLKSSQDARTKIKNILEFLDELSD